jgi:hypothetical protein
LIVEDCLEVVLGVLITTTNFEGDQGKRQEVSEHEWLLPLGLALNLAWSSCLLLFAVLLGVVLDREANLVPLPAMRKVMGGFLQLDEEPGQDDYWRNRIER